MPGFSDVTQVAVISRDALGTIGELRNALGAGSFKVVTMAAPQLFNTHYDGEPEPWTMRLGISWIGDMQLEVIEPLSGRSVFSDFLGARDGRSGIQHVFLARKSLGYEAALSRLDEAGYPFKQHGQVNASGRLGFLPMPALPSCMARFAARFGYTSSQEALKLDIELAKFPPGVSQRLALRAAVAETWVPEDDRAHFESPPPDALLRDIDALYVLTHDLQALVAAYARLTDRAPSVERYDDDVLPGRGRLAPVRFATTMIYLVEPSSGALADRLEASGEGVQVLRAQPFSDQLGLHLASRGWSLDAATDTGALASHAKVPFGLWIEGARP